MDLEDIPDANLTSSDDEDMPLALELAKKGTNNELPLKSKAKYESSYNRFMEWRAENKIQSFDEKIFLGYFKELAKNYKPSSLWATYSMLRAVINVKHNINIQPYFNLLIYLKKNATGYQSKKAQVLTADNITKFLQEAPDKKYLAVKVALIFGVQGGCRRSELCNLTVDDIQEKGDMLLVKIRSQTRKEKFRSFVVHSEFYPIYKKYADLRPPNVTTRRFFLSYRNDKCISQVIGVNTFGSIPKTVATYLKLENPETYTGHTFRRTSASLAYESGPEGWKRSSVVEGFQTQYVKPTRLSVREEDVVRMILEFLDNRKLHISQLGLERETGVINDNYSDDVLFLRQLILDGQWDDVLHFIQQLEEIESFEMRKFTYIILKYKYIELLCIKSEMNVAGNGADNAVEEVVKVLNDLEKYAPTTEIYSNLCLLLTLPSLADNLQYEDWNPSNARVQCFRQVYPLVKEYFPGDACSRTETSDAKNKCAQNDRLIQLIIKGLLYESCVSYLKSTDEMKLSNLLDKRAHLSDSDSCLLNWLPSVPRQMFSAPLGQTKFDVDIKRLKLPVLETVWTEHMVATPIKPNIFPHSVTPFKRVRSAAHIVARSLMPKGNRLVENKHKERRTVTPEVAEAVMVAKSKSPERKISNASTSEVKAKDPSKCVKSSVNEYKIVEGKVRVQPVQTIDRQCLDKSRIQKSLGNAEGSGITDSNSGGPSDINAPDGLTPRRIVKIIRRSKGPMKKLSDASAAPAKILINKNNFVHVVQTRNAQYLDKKLLKTVNDAPSNGINTGLGDGVTTINELHNPGGLQEISYDPVPILEMPKLIWKTN